jgi:hypothetical protein
MTSKTCQRRLNWPWPGRKSAPDQQLAGWIVASPPSLPRPFKPDLTVQAGVRQVIIARPRTARRACAGPPLSAAEP